MDQFGQAAGALIHRWALLPVCSASSPGAPGPPLGHRRESLYLLGWPASLMRPSQASCLPSAVVCFRASS